MTTQPTTQYPPAVVPDRLFDDENAEARWRQRFQAVRMSAPGWAFDAPAANLYVSNASGVFEVYAWDRDTGEHRRVTDRPNGTMRATLSPDGRWIWWFDDTDGDEFGSWVREPFHGGESAQRAVADVPAGYPAGLELGHRVIAAGVSSDEGSSLYAHTSSGTERFYHSADDAGVAALSRDENLLAIVHSEHGDSRHPALRVVACDGFATVAQKWDGPGKGLDALEFSPVTGDARLLVSHERRGREELLVWDVLRDTEIELELELPGEVVAAWYPDGDALLVVHFHQ